MLQFEWHACRKVTISYHIPLVLINCSLPCAVRLSKSSLQGYEGNNIISGYPVMLFFFLSRFRGRDIPINLNLDFLAAGMYAVSFNYKG